MFFCAVHHIDSNLVFRSSKNAVTESALSVGIGHGFALRIFYFLFLFMLIPILEKILVFKFTAVGNYSAYFSTWLCLLGSAII